MKNKILAIPGVSQVVSIGGELPEYQVNVDQNHLESKIWTTQPSLDQKYRFWSFLGPKRPFFDFISHIFDP